MKKILYNIAPLALLICMAMTYSSCSDDDVMVGSITVKEAQTDGSKMLITLKDNETLQLSPFIMPRDAKNQNLTYENMFNDILEVDQSGLITGKSAGLDTITIRSTDGSGRFVKYPVKVRHWNVKAEKIDLLESLLAFKLENGQTKSLGSASIKFTPTDTYNKELTYSTADATIATVDQDGLVTAVGKGRTVIRITTKDGSNVYTEGRVTVVETGLLDYEDRSKWTITTSYPYRPDGTTGKPEDMLDGKTDTFLSLLKPGKESLPEDTECSFVVDLKEELDIAFLRLTYRTNNSSSNMRVKVGSAWGSLDGTNFTLIKDKLEFANAADENQFLFEDEVKYRYFKFKFEEWNSGGMTLQISEFNIGYKQK